MIERIACGLLRDDEVDTLVELADRIWHANYPAIISLEQIDYMLAQRYKPALIRQTVARGDRWEVARDGETLVGFAHGYPMEGGDYKLDKLYVHPDYQRHGIGRALLERIIDHAHCHDCERLVLRVNRNNANAIAAYRNYGFSVVTEFVEDIGGGFVMDDYVMIKEL